MGKKKFVLSFSGPFRDFFSKRGFGDFFSTSNRLITGLIIKPFFRIEPDSVPNLAHAHPIHTSKLSEQSPKTEVIPNLIVLFSELENSSRTRLQFFLSDSETATFLDTLHKSIPC